MKAKQWKIFIITNFDSGIFMGWTFNDSMIQWTCRNNYHTLPEHLRKIFPPTDIELIHGIGWWQTNNSLSRASLYIHLLINFGCYDKISIKKYIKDKITLFPV